MQVELKVNDKSVQAEISDLELGMRGLKKVKCIILSIYTII